MITALIDNNLTSVADCPGFGCRIPFDGTYIVTQAFANQSSSGFRHRGVDLIKDDGTINNSPIVAAGDGVVEAVNTLHWSYGRHVLIRHGIFVDTEGRRRTISTLYAHFADVLVSAGEAVRQGRIIGHADNTGYSTGPHLHWEVRYDEYRVSPLTQVRQPLPPPPPPPPPDDMEEFMASLTEEEKDALRFVAQQQRAGKIVYAGIGKSLLIAMMDAYGALPDDRRPVVNRRIGRFMTWLGAQIPASPANIMDRLNKTLSLPGQNPTATAIFGEGMPEPEDDGRDE